MASVIRFSEARKLLEETLPPSVEVVSPGSDTRPLLLRSPATGRVAVYCWILTESRSGTKRPEREYKTQLKLPGQAENGRGKIPKGQGTVLMLGYSSEHDVLVSWETRHHLDFAYNANIQIPGDVLEQAQRKGFAAAPLRELRAGPEVRVACPRVRFVELVTATCEADQLRLTAQSRLDWLERRLYREVASQAGTPPSSGGRSDKGVRTVSPGSAAGTARQQRTAGDAVTVTKDGRTWRVKVEFIRADGAPLYDVSEETGNDPDGGAKALLVRFNQAHPYCDAFLRDARAAHAAVHLIAMFAIAEWETRDSGVRHVGQVRRWFNKLADAMADERMSGR